MLKKFLKIVAIVLIISFIPISSFGDEIEDLTSQLAEATAIIKELVEENIELANSLEETTKSLEDSTKLIEKQKKRIEEDQKEIQTLRDHIVGLNNLQDIKYFTIGLEATYPIGGQILMEVFVPKLPIGFVGSLGINEKQSILLGAGILFRF